MQSQRKFQKSRHNKFTVTHSPTLSLQHTGVYLIICIYIYTHKDTPAHARTKNAHHSSFSYTHTKHSLFLYACRELSQAALDTLMGGRTVVMIAHRMSTVMAAHRIIVMSKGAVVEQGTHTELLSKKEGVYANLVKAQLTSMPS